METSAGAYGDNLRHIEHLWITLSDGRRLAARLWLPADAEQSPVPAILEYLPYRKRDGTTARDEVNFPAYTRAGYAGVRVDIAGSGDSDGLLSDEYSEDELASGVELIEWIAAQPWCSGAVGMIGISWGGFNGLQIAMRRPAALKAIVTVCSSADRYADDIHYMGGCLLTDNFNWAAQMSAYMTRPPDPLLRDDWREVWLERIQALPFLAVEWLGHQRRDAYWRRGSVCEDWAAIRCAVLAVSGWADAYSDTPARLLANLSAPTRALVGPWEHKYPNLARIAPTVDFHGEVLRWFDHWLKGEDNGTAALPAYRAYIQDFDPPRPNYDPQPGRWVAESAWPSTNISQHSLHLAEGRLQETPGSGSVAVASPQHVGDAAGHFCPGMRVDNDLADDQTRDDAHSLCFDGDPLADAIDVLGAPEVELDLACDRPQAFLALRLCDVAPDGGSMRVSYLPFNLTHRDRQAAPTPLEPGRRYRLRIPLKHCGHRFAAGHRIRLAVSTAYWPVVWPSPEAARVTLHLEACRLVLPVRTASAEDACGELPPAPPVETPAATMLREPESRTGREVLEDGTRVLSYFDDFGARQDPFHGLAVHSSVHQSYAIRPDDPLSARCHTRWSYALSRGDWRVRIDSENEMTSTRDHFHLTRRVTAYVDETRILEREWDEAVPRDHV
jgi:putative CocE/NonD family hydrolase